MWQQNNLYRSIARKVQNANYRYGEISKLNPDEVYAKRLHHNSCMRCNIPTDNLVLDFIIPQAVYPLNHIRNIQFLCIKCASVSRTKYWNFTDDDLYDIVPKKFKQDSGKFKIDHSINWKHIEQSNGKRCRKRKIPYGPIAKILQVKYGPNPQCVQCGVKHLIEIHHIYSVASELGNGYYFNLIPLCHRCHENITDYFDPRPDSDHDKIVLEQWIKHRKRELRST